MGASQQYTRIDTLELKTLLCQKIGHQRSDKYFDLLKKLFGLQLTKSEFDKLCIRTIGRENLPLHNRLISSIVKNASLAKAPPLRVKKLANSLNVKVPNGCQKHNLQTLYGDAFPLSPRKSRSPRDRRFRDRPSPLGPNGKTNAVANAEAGVKVQQERQQHQSPTELHSLGSIPPIEVLSVEDGEEVVSGSPGIQSRSPVTAPLGISLNVNGARKALFGASVCTSYPQTCENSCELPDSRSLRSRLVQKLDGEGVSISEDCANLLNVGLDAYLKRLIEPCIGLVQSRISQTIPGLNGGLLPGRYWQRPRMSSPSLTDFCVALECDPHKLGGDWATQIEKIQNSTLVPFK